VPTHSVLGRTLHPLLRRAVRMQVCLRRAASSLLLCRLLTERNGSLPGRHPATMWKTMSRSPSEAWEEAQRAGLGSRSLPHESLTEPGARKLRFVCISDTHGKHDGLEELPEGEP